jgi:hypothetical protein
MSTPQAPAETLHAAAQLLRERAREAAPGPWRVSFIDGTLPVVDGPGGGHLVAETRQRADAEYIAGMHPAVGLALADLLESFATCGCEEDGDHWPEKAIALRLARLILGEAEGVGR